MTKVEDRYQESRNKRLAAEVNKEMNNWPVKYSCIYRLTEQANQYKRGWQSVSQVDIKTAITLATTPGANT